MTTRLSNATTLRMTALYGEVFSVASFQYTSGTGGTGAWEADNRIGFSGAVSGNSIGGLRGSGGNAGGSTFNWLQYFVQGQMEQSDQYIFNGSLRLTHTLSPRTYFELEYLRQDNVDNQHPMRAQNRWTQQAWIYHKLDATAPVTPYYKNAQGQNLGGLLLNSEGRPATFITTDPYDVFPDGIAQRLDPSITRWKESFISRRVSPTWTSGASNGRGRESSIRSPSLPLKGRLRRKCWRTGSLRTALMNCLS